MRIGPRGHHRLGGGARRAAAGERRLGRTALHPGRPAPAARHPRRAGRPAASSKAKSSACSTCRAPSATHSGRTTSFILRTLADQAAVAVNSARAYEAQRVEAWTTTVMLQVAEATSQAESMERSAGGGSPSHRHAGRRRVDHDLAVGRRVSRRSSTARRSACEGGDDDDFAHGLRFLDGDWPALDSLRLTRRPLVLQPGAGGDALPAEFHLLCSGDLVALLPMLNKGEVFGVLGVGFGRERAASSTSGGSPCWAASPTRLLRRSTTPG